MDLDLEFLFLFCLDSKFLDFHALRFPKFGQEGLFLANPDLANILGDTDVDLENFIFKRIFVDSKFLDFQVPRFPKSGPGRA